MPTFNMLHVGGDAPGMRQQHVWPFLPVVVVFSNTSPVALVFCSRAILLLLVTPRRIELVERRQ